MLWIFFPTNNHKIYCCSVFALTFKRLIYHNCVLFAKEGIIHERKMCSTLFSHPKLESTIANSYLIFATWHSFFMFLKHKTQVLLYLEWNRLSILLRIKKIFFWLFSIPFVQWVSSSGPLKLWYHEKQQFIVKDLSSSIYLFCLKRHRRCFWIIDKTAVAKLSIFICFIRH